VPKTVGSPSPFCKTAGLHSVAGGPYISSTRRRREAISGEYACVKLEAPSRGASFGLPRREGLTVLDGGRMYEDLEDAVRAITIKLSRFEKQNPFFFFRSGDKGVARRMAEAWSH